MSRSVTFGVYTTQLPFLDTKEAKVRPVIVVSQPHGKHNVIAIIPLSSKPNQEAVDIALSHWQNEGLVKPSIARVHRITTILQSDLLTELGQLDTSDIEALKESIRTFLNLQKPPVAEPLPGDVLGSTPLGDAI
ncbi:MAG TPA: type II toxin-antitoxin system PemK/MazF family toxin [Candidatus Saccharimonadales bacterium]|nr:type II toxin-antitoxin system PemK/MazF family toxin [Candidatus Saccharimonadales bacterium]